MSTVAERKEFEATKKMKSVMGQYFVELTEGPEQGKKTAWCIGEVLTATVQLAIEIARLNSKPVAAEFVKQAVQLLMLARIETENEELRLKKGDNLIFAAFGGGFTWGAIYLTWAYDTH